LESRHRSATNQTDGAYCSWPGRKQASSCQTRRRKPACVGAVRCAVNATAAAVVAHDRIAATSPHFPSTPRPAQTVLACACLRDFRCLPEKKPQWQKQTPMPRPEMQSERGEASPSRLIACLLHEGSRQPEERYRKHCHRVPARRTASTAEAVAVAVAHGAAHPPPLVGRRDWPPVAAVAIASGSVAAAAASAAPRARPAAEAASAPHWPSRARASALHPIPTVANYSAVPPHCCSPPAWRPDC